jgi:hypothetical protein
MATMASSTRGLERERERDVWNRKHSRYVKVLGNMRKKLNFSKKCIKRT